MAVILTVIGPLAITLLLTAMVMVQVNQLAKDLPRYQVTLREKIHDLRNIAGPAGLLKGEASSENNRSRSLSGTTAALTNPKDRPGNVVG